MNHNRATVKFVLKVTLVTILGIACLSGNNLFAQITDPVRLTNRKTIPVIELKGTGYERGIQHGRGLKKEISEVYRKWKSNIRNVAGASPDSVITAFLKATNFEPISRKYTPWLLKELLGIADG
jgi:isopenicillin-N N-acyltransferase-like protein